MLHHQFIRLGNSWIFCSLSSSSTLMAFFSVHFALYKRLQKCKSLVDEEWEDFAKDVEAHASVCLSLRGFDNCTFCRTSSHIYKSPAKLQYILLWQNNNTLANTQTNINNMEFMMVHSREEFRINIYNMHISLHK